MAERSCGPSGVRRLAAWVRPQLGAVFPLLLIWRGIIPDCRKGCLSSIPLLYISASLVLLPSSVTLSVFILFYFWPIHLSSCPLKIHFLKGIGSFVWLLFLWVIWGVRR